MSRSLLLPLDFVLGDIGEASTAPGLVARLARRSLSLSPFLNLRGEEEIS